MAASRRGRVAVAMCAAVAGSTMVAGAARAAAPVTVNWSRQISTPQTDEAYGVAVDGAGNSYVAGSTGGNVGGTPLGWDGYVRKYDPAGNVAWSTQFNLGGAGTEPQALAVDALGSVVVAGEHGTSPNGGTGFVRKDTP